MKKIIGLVLVLAVLAAAVPVWAIEGTTTMKTSDLLSLAGRKTYGLGLRLSMLSPTKDILVSKDSTIDFGLEFDAKLNENLDTGPRFGVCTFKNNQGSSLNATYTVIRFGYGARIYVLSWGEYTSSHGPLNAYLDAEANYYTANKASEVTLSSPSSFAGFGGNIGAGLEMAFGPNTRVFAQLDYSRTSIKDGNSNSLPLDGYIVAAGTRLAFF
jgi:hypothetical protein